MQEMFSVFGWFFFVSWAGLMAYWQVVVNRQLKDQVNHYRNQVRAWERYFDELYREQEPGEDQKTDS